MKELKEYNVFELLIKKKYDDFKEIIWYSYYKIPLYKNELIDIEREK